MLAEALQLPISERAEARKAAMAAWSKGTAEPARFELASRAKRAAGQLLSGPKVDSVNTFAAPATVAPKPFAANGRGGKIVLNVPPHSVAVVALEGMN